jgi:hypothetical protein
MKPLRYRKEDRIAYVLVLAFLAGVIALRVLLPWPQ